jgi:hypothetical protein
MHSHQDSPPRQAVAIIPADVSPSPDLTMIPLHDVEGR